jgi:hypothetical protein
MNYSNTSIKNFIEHVISFDCIDDILKSCLNKSEKGFIFEKLFDIIIKFGFCDIFNNKNFNHIMGNSNNGKPIILKNYVKYLNEKVISGNASGCSDITLQNKHDETFTFITSKYYNSSKDVLNYDIQNILSMILHNSKIYEVFDIFILVKNKNKVLEKVKNSNKSSEYITKYMTIDNILDEKDLQKYFLNFKCSIIQNLNVDWTNTYLIMKENLNLRFHQELITLKTSDLIEKNNKSFLWGCKCRSGKTFMVGGLIKKQFLIRKKLNVLIITPAPNETINQFTEDLFYKFNDFNNFKIHNIKSSIILNKITIDENNIFIMSKQLLQNYVKKNTIQLIKNLNLNIIIFDENHFSGTTKLSKQILKSYKSDNTVNVYLTATYHKPLIEWNISNECQMFWNVEEEQICKSIITDIKNLDKLKELQGEYYVNETLKFFNQNIIDIFKPYENMPNLYLITNMFDSQKYDELKNSLNNQNKLGFCFETLFGLNKQKTRFMFENEVKLFLRYISGSLKHIDGEKTIFTRIYNYCSNIETRKPFTQIWFLPSNNINEISKCLKLFMMEDSVLKNYNILIINGNSDDLKNVKDIKNDIIKQEKIAKKDNKLGLILLAGNMLTLGITLNLCDVVILLNNTLSSDKILQQMYRCMTEGENKKCGFVIDLNISRVLNTCLNYSIHKKDLNVNEKINYLIKYHLINIDVDMMFNEKLDEEKIIKKLLDVWKHDPINSFRVLIKNLEDDYKDFDNDTQHKINEHFIHSCKDEIINTKIIVKNNDKDIQTLQNGKEIINETNECKSDEAEKKVEEIEILFTKDILPFIIPLTCILTIKEKNINFITMLEFIKNNNELLETFNEQSFIWWKKTNLIQFIIEIIKNFFNENSNTFNVCIQFKMQLNSLTDEPDKLLNLINECLKPKDIEKKQFGEVFTPLSLINEMLDNIPLGIWNDKNLKWLDPATGMGNFQIVVFLRLMNSLKSIIPDENERKKHIIENMLYSCELNKKNIYIYKQIFNIHNNYTLNLYEGDTLILNPKKYFNIDKFDIILGNPPYNKGGIKSHTGKLLNTTEKNETIWPKFIIKAFEWLNPEGYLLFINPLSWLKKSHSVHDILLEKHILWMKLWDDSKSKNTIGADIPISLYVLKNIINTNLLTNIQSEMKRQKLCITTKIYLNKKYSIPLAYHEIFSKLILFIEKNNLNLEYNTKTVKSVENPMKLPLNYTLNDSYAVETFTIKEGIIVKKTLEKHVDSDKTKIIISNKRCFVGSFIDYGKLGLTGNHKFYILGNNLNVILKIMNFKIMNIVCDNLKYGQSFLDNVVFDYIPDIRKLNIFDITENEFYKLIGLNEDDINTINFISKN